MATRVPGDTERGINEQSPEARAAWREAHRNFAWANAHRDEIERHAGQWVAIADQQIVVMEADRERFIERVRAGNWVRNGAGPYVLYVATPEELTGIHPGFHVAVSQENTQAPQCRRHRIAPIVVGHYATNYKELLVLLDTLTYGDASTPAACESARRHGTARSTATLGTAPPASACRPVLTQPGSDRGVPNHSARDHRT